MDVVKKIKEIHLEFLKKRKSNELDINLFEDLKEIKKAIKIHESVKQINREDELELSDEQIKLTSTFLIEKEIISKRKKKKDRKYHRLPHFKYNRISFESYIPPDIYELMTKNTLMRTEEYYDYLKFENDILDYEVIEIFEPTRELLMKTLSKLENTRRIDGSDKNFTLIGYNIGNLISD